MTDTHAEISKYDDASARDLASSDVGNGTVPSDVRNGGIRRERGANGIGTHHGVTAIPGSIVRAICAIKATVEALKKSQRNQHGGYNFSSTDDLYAAISRKEGEVGLTVVSLETEYELKRIDTIDKDGKPRVVQWLRVVYQFVWATETDTWTDEKNKRTICVQYTGPQTSQAAQSFIEKAYYRSIYKLPSGDMDLDSMPQAEYEDDQNDLLAPRKRKSSNAAKKDGTDVVFNELRGAISGADGPADLHMIKKNSWSVWQQMPERWRQILDAEFDDRMAEFEQMEPAQ